LTGLVVSQLDTEFQTVKKSHVSFSGVTVANLLYVCMSKIATFLISLQD
jgi:hypothetical protein